MTNYGIEKYKESNPGNNEYDKNRESYSLYSNNCGTFAADVVDQDPNVEQPTTVINTPKNIVENYIDEGNAEVNYDPKTNKTTVGKGDEKKAKKDGGKKSQKPVKKGANAK